MAYISSFGKKLEHLCTCFFPTKLPSSCHHFKPFWAQLCYFLVVSLVGYLALRFSKPRTIFVLDDLDVFFTSVSATTVSSMSTVEMEVFSDAQLTIITLLMFFGGEVFLSLLGLLFQRFNLSSTQNSSRDSLCVVDPTYRNNETWAVAHEHMLEVGRINQTLSVTQEQTIELSIITLPPPPLPKNKQPSSLATKFFTHDDKGELHLKSIKSLGYVVLSYLFVIQLVGSILMSIYISLTPSANKVLHNKGLVPQTFSIFTIVSTFTNCGFMPTNENIMVFRENSGLLLILIPQILLGNTLYPPCLRLMVYVLERLTKKKEYTYILDHYQDLGFGHLMSSTKCWYLVGTVIVLWINQFVAFLAMEWNSGVMEGMNSHQKIVGSLFQSVSSRHTGESIVDLSSVSSAILVLFVIMMYLPPYASLLPICAEEKEASQNKKAKKRKKGKFIENIAFSQLSYLAIFVFFVCITERKSLKEDPLNFNVLNIVVEVVSAYGNVGFSTGYSCKRRLTLDGNCEDKLFGFVGRWSKQGKIILILVMFFGRLKKFNMYGGKAWTLL